MKIWIDRILMILLFAFTFLLAATALPAVFDGHLSGNMLLAHMLVSGALVFLLPLCALVWLWPNISSRASGVLQRLGFWSTMLLGFATICTVFLCMLPIAPTEVMHELIRWHGYAGFAMVPAVVVLAIGWLRWLRMAETRSETPG